MTGWQMLFYKEVLRFWKVGFQTVAAPVLTAALYLLYFFLTQALVRILLTPANGKWRIIEVSNDRAQASSKALIFSAAAICIVSFFQSLAAEMNVNPEVLYSLKIFANAVKAFCVVLVANKFLFDGTPEDDAIAAA